MLLAVLAAGCAAVPDEDLTKTFHQAQQTFDAAQQRKDFLKAASLYQEVLDRGVVSGGLLYNQGNAWMRAGERGRAIAAYRQAQRYWPRNPYLEANLDFALGAGQPARPKPVIEHLLFWQDWLSYPNKFVITASLAVLAAALGLIGLFRRRTAIVRRAALAFALAAGVMAVSAGYDWYRIDHLRHGVVIAEQTIARKGNSASYQATFTEPLDEGAEFRVLEVRGSWLRVRFAGGEDAWIPELEAVIY